MMCFWEDARKGIKTLASSASGAESPTESRPHILAASVLSGHDLPDKSDSPDDRYRATASRVIIEQVNSDLSRSMFRCDIEREKATCCPSGNGIKWGYLPFFALIRFGCR
jgi:hypothetical protein